MHEKVNHSDQSYSPSVIPSVSFLKGYSTDKQMATPRSCLDEKKGNIETTDGGVGVISFGKAISHDQLEKDLNVDVSASAKLGLFSTKDSAVYVRDTKEDSYSLTFNFIEKIILPTSTFEPVAIGTDALNEFGRKSYELGADVFRNNCGDYFINNVIYGAGLYVTLKVNFDSISDKTSFTGELGASWGDIISVSTKISDVVNKLHTKGHIEVTALQLGGDPTKLASIFTSGPDPYAISTCSLEKFEDCQKVVNGVLNYAANDFSKQFDNLDAQTLNKATVIDYNLEKYSEAILIKDTKSVLTDEIEAVRANLGDIYLDILDDQAFITHIMHSPIYNSLAIDLKNSIKETAANLYANKQVLEDPFTGGIACYTSPTECVEIGSKISNKLKPIDEKLIDKIKDSYNIEVKASIERHGHACNDNYNCNYSKPLTDSTFIAMPTDQKGVYEYSYLGNMYNVQIIRNNDNTLSIDFNGTKYQSIASNNGEYDVIFDWCNNKENHLPQPFDNFITDAAIKEACPATHHCLGTLMVDFFIQPIDAMY
jgi:hypothetical protein